MDRISCALVFCLLLIASNAFCQLSVKNRAVDISLATAQKWPVYDRAGTVYANGKLNFKVNELKIDKATPWILVHDGVSILMLDNIEVGITSSINTIEHFKDEKAAQDRIKALGLKQVEGAAESPVEDTEPK